MACKQCGSACQGRLCQFCEFDQRIDGDWQSRFSDTEESDD